MNGVGEKKKRSTKKDKDVITFMEEFKKKRQKVE
jgi:hypothetical protein